MSYPVPRSLRLPTESYVLQKDYHQFGDRVRRKVILWATHLGDDVIVPAGTQVVACGDGEVVWAEYRAGSAERPNWGGVVILGHQHRKSGQSFFTVYGHLRDLTVAAGDVVVQHQQLGEVAAGNTPENGWWRVPHLHFAVYVGPWRGEILPGYKRAEQLLGLSRGGRTRLNWWRDPQKYIFEYNQ